MTVNFGSSDNSLTYAYDGAGRVSSRTANIGGSAYASNYGYLAGDTTRYGTGASSPLISGITQTGHNLSYTYDDVGNILSVAYGGKTTTYVYDTLGQLTRANDPARTTPPAALRAPPGHTTTTRAEIYKMSNATPIQSEHQAVYCRRSPIPMGMPTGRTS